MNSQTLEEDRKLSGLLRESRPEPSLPPGFQQVVWRRIERGEAAQDAPNWAFIERLTEALLRPRFALTSLSIVLTVGMVAGVWQGQDDARGIARARYVAAVAPGQVH